MRVVEQMRRIEWQHLVVRLWLEVEDAARANVIRDVAFAFLNAKRFRKSLDVQQFAEDLHEGFNEVNAVEIVDDDGNGIVVYFDWP